MAHSTRSAIASFLVGLSLATSAAQPAPKRDTIEISLGETTYVQLSSSTPTGRPVRAIQVQDPNRDYYVIKFTFEAGPDGARHYLNVRNGYDEQVFFSQACSQSSTSDGSISLMAGAPPGREVRIQISPSTTKLSLCDFTVAAPSIR